MDWIEVIPCFNPFLYTIHVVKGYFSRSHAGASLPLSFRGFSFFEKKQKPRIQKTKTSNGLQGFT